MTTWEIFRREHPASPWVQAGQIEALSRVEAFNNFVAAGKTRRGYLYWPVAAPEPNALFTKPPKTGGVL